MGPALAASQLKTWPSTVAWLHAALMCSLADFDLGAQFYIEGGKAADKPYRNPSMWTFTPSQDVSRTPFSFPFPLVEFTRAQTLQWCTPPDKMRARVLRAHLPRGSRIV